MSGSINRLCQRDCLSQTGSCQFWDRQQKLRVWAMNLSSVNLSSVPKAEACARRTLDIGNWVVGGKLFEQIQSSSCNTFPFYFSLLESVRLWSLLVSASTVTLW